MLWLYWLTSGYGLRASRALLALALTVATFTVAFHAWGYDPQQSWLTAFLDSAESTTSLFRSPNRESTTSVGEALQLPLRILGPLFFGLAVVSLRGRVKR